MFERILVPLDGSELAESVLVQVRRLLMQKDAEVLLLRAVTLPPPPEADAGVPLELLWSRAAEYMQNVAGRLSSQGARVLSRVVEGPAANAILDAARKEGASLIAMSTHGRTGLARWVFGSVTEKVLRASPVPVLAVPSFTGSGGDAFATGPRELPFRKILVPIAPADLSLGIVPPVLEFARLFGAHVHLLNVCEGPECAVAVPQMTRAFEQLRDGGVSVEPLMKQGDPAVQILESCQEKASDLVAMTTHGHSGVSRWVLGSVAEKVLRASRVPLLVVRTAPAAGVKAPARSKGRKAAELRPASN
jgi:nucleotide-binding universal stress UspA family protein